MTRALVLKLPDFMKKFIIQSDAPGTCMGVVWTQNGRPLSFLSKMLGHKLQNSSTFVREFTCNNFKNTIMETLLLGNQFIVETYQNSLRKLMN